MIDLKVSDIRTFLPSEDYALSKGFYAALGGKLEYTDANLSLVAFGAHRFYLQNAYVKEWADNCMLHVSVEDAQSCYTQVAALVESGRFPGIRVRPPIQEPYGALVTYVWDPVGVLIHLAQWTNR